jgi:hypothetical protein
VKTVTVGKNEITPVIKVKKKIFMISRTEVNKNCGVVTDSYDINT